MDRWMNKDMLCVYVCVYVFVYGMEYTCVEYYSALKKYKNIAICRNIMGLDIFVL